METSKVTLDEGSSYWLEFKNSKGRSVWAPTKIVRVRDTLMGEGYDGQVFNLPKEILTAQKMGPFQTLNWRANCYARAGNVEHARLLKDQAYHVMDDQWYLARIEKMTQRSDRYTRGLHERDPVLDDAVDELRQYRPDIAVDSLTYVKRQAFDLDSLIHQLTSPAEEDPSPSRHQNRICAFFRRLVRCK